MVYLLDSQKLEKYFSLKASSTCVSLIPKGSSRIQVSAIRRLSGGMTNNVFSFSLKFDNNTKSETKDLVFKRYGDDLGIWTQNCSNTPNYYTQEYTVMKALEKEGFPVPQAYFYEPDPSYFGYPFLIMKQEKPIQGNVEKLDTFASILGDLHNLDATKLDINTLSFPKDNLQFARNRLTCLENYLKSTNHYRFVKKDFNLAIEWLKERIEKNACPKYCLIHGEYHPGHTLLTSNGLKIIDWESVTIGDPAFDVGYAYQMIKIMYDESKAEKFVSDYTSRYEGAFKDRMNFYEMVALLGVAEVVSALISDPLNAYRNFGSKALARALIFPFVRTDSKARKWLNQDFLLSFLDYSRHYIRTNLNQ